MPAFERDAVEIGSEVLIDAGDGTAGTAREAEARPGIGAGRAPGLNVSDFAVRGRVVAISPSPLRGKLLIPLIALRRALSRTGAPKLDRPAEKALVPDLPPLMGETA